MALLSDSAETLLATKTGVDMKTAAGTTLYTTPVGKVTRITKIVVRDPSATLAGGTSYSLTGWGTAFSLATLVTANTGFVTVTFAAATAPTECTEIAAATNVVFTVTTGSTGAATAVIDVFGYTT
jgi:hypothetical protein